MPNEAKLAFAFLPRRTTVEQTDEYIKAVYEEFTGEEDEKRCVTVLSALQVTSSPPDLDVTNKPFITDIVGSKRNQDLWARAKPILAIASVAGIDYLFFNTGMIRYSVEVFIEFVKQSFEVFPTVELVVAEPPILSPNKVEEFVSGHSKELDKAAVRQRLLADAFIDFVVCKALNTDKFYNLNPGIFRLRTTEEVLSSLLCAKQYGDNSLVCPQFLWQMRYGFDFKMLPIKDISLKKLGFNLEKAAQEIFFIFDLAAKSGEHQVISTMVDDFFRPEGPCSRWASQKDRDWFHDVLRKRVEKLYKA